MTAAVDITRPAVVVGTRDPAVDAARGIAMILVVFGHALDGAQAAGHSTYALRFTMILLYSSHVPLLLLMSGILSKPLCTREWPDFLKTLSVRIFWPYLLWAFILLTLLFLLGGYTNTDLQTYQPLSILWRAPAVLWFLYVLAVSFVILRLLSRLQWYWIAGVGVACLALPYLTELWPQKSRFVGMVLIGAAAGPVALRVVMRPPLVLMAVSVMMVMIWLSAERAQMPLSGYPSYEAVFIPANFAGPLLIYAFSRWLSQICDTGLIEAVGRNTMAIFVTHILVTAGPRIVLLRWGVVDWGLIIAIGTVGGVLLPLGAALYAKRIGVSKLLGWQ